MKYRYRAVDPFWTHFYRLTAGQKESARRAWKIFKQDPFDSRLRTHKIHKLSALYRRTIYAVDIEAICVLHFILKETRSSPWTSARMIFTNAEKRFNSCIRFASHPQKLICSRNLFPKLANHSPPIS